MNGTVSNDQANSRRTRKSSSIERPKVYNPSQHMTSISNISTDCDIDFITESDKVWTSLLEEGIFHVGDQTTVDLDLILPNGILVPVKCPTTRTLAMLKQDLFLQAKRLPLSSKLLEMNNYVFFTIGMDGTHVELYDEQKTIASLHLCLPILSLIEPEGNKIEKELNQNISTALGIPLHEVEKNIDEELRDFRFKLFGVCETSEDERGISGTSHYAFPEERVIKSAFERNPCRRRNSQEMYEEDLDFVLFPEDPEETETKVMHRLNKKIQNSDSYAEIWYRKLDSDEFSYSTKIKNVMGRTPQQIIEIAIALFKQDGIIIPEGPEEFILQVAGKHVFLTRDIHITRFEYVRSCFENFIIPRMILRRKEIVFQEFPTPLKLFEPSYVRAERKSTLRPDDTRPNIRQFWDLDDNLRIRILTASNITVHDIEKIFIRVAVSVGRHVLDKRDSAAVSPSNPRWQNGQIEFNIYLKDLPESAQLSFSLISVRQKKSKTEVFVPIGWVNIRLFDWKNRLLQGNHTLYLWPFPKDHNDMLNLRGIQGSNHNHNVTRIEVDFPAHGGIIEFPSPAIINKFVSILHMREARNNKGEVMNTSLVDGSDSLERLLSLRQQLDSSKLSEDDQQFLWKMRYKIQSNFPQMLPILADCPYIWKERETICEFYSLLANWPDLNVDSAMELLDGRYPDCVVRATAVNKLDEKLGDDQMQLYLLPLIQAIKYESFSASPLALLLVKRALLNYHIGHTLFWLLRAELAQFTYEVNTQRMPQMYVRYALMLEAYCRGNSVHLESMLKQVEMVNTLTALSAMVKSMSAKEASTKKLQQELKLLKDSLQHMQSPMNSTDRLGELIIDECRVLSSAKMPLKLTWNNPEPLSRLTIPTHQIMFKNGDDLRQDMLTLQAMRIMDTKWKNHNLDYCMTLYEVLPMGRSIGMIHLVQNCQTIFQIQMAAKQVSSALNMDNTLLNRYIYQKCSNDSKQYMECVDRFAYSLAGYSIATYVLGIKDRHQDNIMLTKDGRIFHIDFGHILGHTKRKLGINRERTDFILTDHFLYVVSRGKPNFRETHEYNSFREACIKGFMVIYHHARFFIALFQMMLCMGLPELSKPEDVHFLHTSLIYEKTKREDAKSAFAKIFDDVAKSDWSTNINWFFHSVKHL